MKKIKVVVGILLLFFTMPALCAGEWFTDFEKAKKAAGERNCPLLAAFTGSDWCPCCEKLKKRVFSKKRFKEYANGNVVLFMADFPKKAQQSLEIKEQNKVLSKKYCVESYPTVLLLHSSGMVIARTGYRDCSARAYVAHITDLLDRNSKLAHKRPCWKVTEGM